MDKSLKCIEFKSTSQKFELKCYLETETFKKLKMNILKLHNYLDAFIWTMEYLMLETSNYSPGLAYRRKPLAVAPKVFSMPTVTESSLVRGSVGMGVFSQNSENI